MRPSELKPTDFNPYYKGYIDLVENISLPHALTKGLEQAQNFFKSLPEATWHHRYAEGKWTPKDILQHINDTERVFAYRALYFARSEHADLKGFDENIFAENARANSKTEEELLSEHQSIRLATISLFKGLEEDQLTRWGIANANPMSVGAAGFIICGHEIHHCNIIKERYIS